MGLLDVINGMQNGPRGAQQPGGSSGGGMSPVTMAILGVLAYKAVKHFSAPAATASSSSPAAPGNEDAGPLGSLGPLGNLIGGGLSGGILSSGLGNLVRDLQGSGNGQAAQSWVGDGPNQPIAPNNLEAALGGDTVDAVARQTGMDRDALLDQLSQYLPGVVDRLTPNGRLPTADEAARMS